MMRAAQIATFLIIMLASVASSADPAPFDLPGPSLQVTVRRNGTTLPIAQVPQLAGGDQLSIHADLPQDQSAHYRLIAAFLRGATNPPPKSWFFQSPTWTRKGAAGLELTVPAGAQQVILFLAPATGGDFSTLVNAVRGRPGAFVRASQGLNQASLDHGRLAAFLKAVGQRDPSDPKRLETITPLLARSLAIKINPDCLEKAPELQAACLMQNQDSLVLNDGHSSGLTSLSGTGSDLALQFAATPQGGLGYYSPYIGAVRDIIGVLNSFHTARYQYIPALATQAGERVDLILNAAPSFHDPKSVLATALPAILAVRPPLLQASAPAEALCALGSELVLPVSGAPLIYATDYAHDMMIRVVTKSGSTIELSATPVASKGGVVVATAALASAPLAGSVDAVLHGRWGFEAFDGPTFHLQTPQSGQWQFADSDSVPVVGRDEPVTLTGGAAACVTGVALQPASGEARPVAWKVAGPNTISLVLPLANADAGRMTLLIAHSGAPDDTVAVTGNAQRPRITGLDLRAGDTFGTLNGNRLDEVASLIVDDVTFKPDGLARANGGDTLRMAAGSAVAAWKPGQSVKGKVHFRDGRTATVRVIVDAPRPGVTLIGKSLSVPAARTAVSVKLADPDQLPHDARLTFSLRIDAGASFSAGDTVEVATIAGTGSTTLSSSDGLILENSQVAVASLDTAKAFGPSVFGPLQFRAIINGVPSDWKFLGTLVRLPSLSQLLCPTKSGACELTGTDMFLIAALSVTPGFEKPIEVPEGYAAGRLTVPHPVRGEIYVKLRDNPAVIGRITG